MSSKKKIAIVGSGPAALMVASELLNGLLPAQKEFEIHLFEKRAGLARKLLIAGSSGLNITHELSPDEFASQYEGWSPSFWASLFKNYSPNDWISFLERELKLETFLGTSKRYFVREMKASLLVKRWITYLEERGVFIHAHSELVGFESEDAKIKLNFLSAIELKTTFFIADYAAFCLGGASWEQIEPAWISLFKNKGLHIDPITPSNVGYEVSWSKKFLAESEGKPLKKIELKTKRGSKLGELVITEYGLEGTPIYFCGVSGEAYLDLKPDLSEAQILKKLSSVKENLSPMRRVKHHLSLGAASESLLFHSATPEVKSDLHQLIRWLKKIPIQLKGPRPLAEAISSRGGLALQELNEYFELEAFPGIFCAGEMLSWDAPTGGFLIQACVSQGASLARNILMQVSR